MSGMRVGKVKREVALHEISYDSSADSDYMGLMKDGGAYGKAEETSEIITQSFLDSSDNSGFKEISKNVTYTFIPMTSSEDTTDSTMQSSPQHEYFVSIANPVEVFATTSPATKKIRRDVTPQQAKVVTAKKRDDKRRATHNEVERRRRDKINTWIMRLAALVPNSGTPDSASKGGILAKACDHITEMNEKQKRLEKLEEENEKLALEVFRLNQELTDLRKENTSVRNQLADNCIVFAHRQKDQKS